jgi:hypothetical protein
VPKNRIGRWLIVAAAVLVPVGVIRWIAESNSMEADARVTAFGGSVVSSGHTLALVIWALAAVLLIVGVILLTATDSPSD